MRKMIWIRVGIGLAVVAVLSVVAWQRFQQRDLMAERNEIIETYYNEQQYIEAARRLETLLDDASGDLEQQLREDIAQAYLDAGSDPGTSHAKTLEYYQRAREFAPHLLNDRQREMIKDGLPATGEALG